MNLSDIRFPVYVVHTDEVATRDGLLWCDGKIVDDKNTSGNSIGERRLKTPQQNLYDLKYQIDTFGDMIKHRGRFYVDTNGKFFIYEKRTTKARNRTPKTGRVEERARKIACYGTIASERLVRTTRQG